MIINRTDTDEKDKGVVPGRLPMQVNTTKNVGAGTTQTPTPAQGEEAK